MSELNLSREAFVAHVGEPMVCFILSVSKRMAPKRHGRQIEARLAGTTAALVALADGEYRFGQQPIPERAARYVSREMRRATAIQMGRRAIPDYGYEHGNIAQRKRVNEQLFTWKNRTALRRRQAGLCVACGQRPQRDRTRCDECLRKSNAARQKGRRSILALDSPLLTLD